MVQAYGLIVLRVAEGLFESQQTFQRRDLEAVGVYKDINKMIRGLWGCLFSVIVRGF